MALLRDPEKGCPWDVEQDFASIAPHTIEEAYEVADAIEKNDMKVLEDELGDLLLQVVFHAQIARESGLFDFDDVAAAICDKLVRRHPHVFGDTKVDNASAQLKAWEDQKAVERLAKAGGAKAGGAKAGGAKTNAARDNGAPLPAAVLHGVLDDVALGMPALTRAVKLQKRAARVGFDWSQAETVLDKVREEVRELEVEISSGAEADRLEDETGDLLFTIANLARKLELDPEKALRRGNSKFERRFRSMEAALSVDSRTPEDASLDEMEALWERAKLDETPESTG